MKRNENLDHRLLVIGLGSIGVRHATLALEMGWSVAGVSRRGISTDLDMVIFTNITQAIQEFSPNFVIVATETSRHFRDIEELAQGGFSNSLMVEKPLFSKMEKMNSTNCFSNVYCAYVMRFHPVMNALKSAIDLDKSPIRYISAHCGQHLSDWRSGRGVQDSYSAQAAKGGGVLRDLSHEIDSVLWLANKKPRSVFAAGGNMGVLGIQADECWSILLRFDGIEPLHSSIGINYFERPAQRHISIVTQDHQYYADFVRGTVTVDGVAVEVISGGRDAMYLDQLAAFEANDERLCTLDEALLTMDVIDMAERSKANGNWVNR